MKPKLIPNETQMKPKTKKEACMALSAALMDCLELLTSEEQKPTGPKLYSLAELAELFDKSKQAVRQWACAGEFGEVVQAGNKIMITEDGLQKYLSDHTGPIKKRETKPRKPRMVMTARGHAERI